MQLLVVVAKGCVGDLEAGLRRRGHPNDLLGVEHMDSAAPLQAAGPERAALLGLVYRRFAERRAPAVPPDEPPKGGSSRAATTSAMDGATASGAHAGRSAAAWASSAAPCLPESTKTPRNPARCAPRTSFQRSSPTIATSRGERREPAPGTAAGTLGGTAAGTAASTRTASAKKARDGLPVTSARRSIAYSRPVTQAPASSKTSACVSHQRFLCMATKRAPFLSNVNADCMFRGVNSSAASPITTAAALASGSAAPRCESSRSPSNSHSQSGAPSTHSCASGKWRRQYPAATEAALTIRSGPTARPAPRSSRDRVARLYSEVLVAIT